MNTCMDSLSRGSFCLRPVLVRALSRASRVTCFPSSEQRLLNRISVGREEAGNSCAGETASDADAAAEEVSDDDDDDDANSDRPEGVV